MQNVKQILIYDKLSKQLSKSKDSDTVKIYDQNFTVKDRFGA